MSLPIESLLAVVPVALAIGIRIPRVRPRSLVEQAERLGRLAGEDHA